MTNNQLFTLGLFLAILFLICDYRKNHLTEEDYDRIARCSWKTPQEVKAMIENPDKTPYLKSERQLYQTYPCLKKHCQTGGYIDAVTNVRRTETLPNQRRSVGQREGQVCNPHMPCHYGLDCYKGVCVLPRSNSFYSDLYD